MSRYNTATARPTGTSAITAQAQPSGRTGEGGPGFARDARSELFLSAVSSFTQNGFYETESELLSRQRALVATLACADPEWVLHFVGWLRLGANIRTGAMVLAAEAVHARLEAKVPDDGDPRDRGINRRLIDAALQRPDEPGEMLAYWTSRFGRAVPMAVKRGIGDAVGRLYTERALLKYDTASKGYRFGDVIELTHPSPVAPWQGDLFAYAISRRHRREDLVVPESLGVLRANAALQARPAHEITALAESGELAGDLAAAGATWESVPALVNGPWTAKLWEAIIPSMGAMALARNLRNFDAEGISRSAVAEVAAKLSDAQAIERSRMLPMRMLSAYRNAPNVRWHAPLEEAVQHTLANVPSLPGRTLILVDRSGSMFGQMSANSQLTYADAAAVFGAALALRAENATLVEFGSTSRKVPIPRGGSLLPMLNAFGDLGGTDTISAITQHFHGHDRVIILTDEQYGGYYRTSLYATPGEAVPADVPLHTVNLKGYRYAQAAGGPNRYWFGGLTDAMFTIIPAVENGSRGRWPWQATTD